MKTFRITDLAVQLVLIIAGIIYGIVELIGEPHFFIYFYFIVGGWQLVSFSFHYFFCTPTIFYSGRMFYGKICLALTGIGIVLCALCFITSEFILLLLVYGFALLWLSPLFAFYYFYNCWREYKVIIKRELIHLK